ncbi:hypothetical protein TNCV_1304061 [Trichonephila clavipes]|nr:hypothetical protein TNCV_1304061 [Trichonephila clavipes]
MISASLNSFQALGVEDLWAPFALVNPALGSRIRLSPGYLGTPGPLGARLTRPIDKPALRMIVRHEKKSLDCLFGLDAFCKI